MNPELAAANFLEVWLLFAEKHGGKLVLVAVSCEVTLLAS